MIKCDKFVSKELYNQYAQQNYIKMPNACLHVCVSHSVMSDSLRPHGLALQSPLSMEFSWQEYWNGQPFPSPEDLSDPGIELGFPALQADSSPSQPSGKPSCLHIHIKYYHLNKFFGHLVHGILVPNHGLNPSSLQQKHRILTTGPPGNSLKQSFISCIVESDMV